MIAAIRSRIEKYLSLSETKNKSGICTICFNSLFPNVEDGQTFFKNIVK